MAKTPGVSSSSITPRCTGCPTWEMCLLQVVGKHHVSSKGTQASLITGVCFSTISLQGQEEAQGSLVSSLPPRSVLGIWDTVASSRHSTTSTNLTSVRVLLSEQPLLDVALSADRIAGKVRAGDALLHQC